MEENWLGKLTKDDLRSVGRYDKYLDRLIEHTDENNFGIVINTLLELAQEEGKLGVCSSHERPDFPSTIEYGEDIVFYKAAFRLEALSVNSRARVNINLKQRKDALLQLLETANAKKDEYLPRYFLIHVLARGCNARRPGDYLKESDEFFEEYIRFCVCQLLDFAGKSTYEDDDEENILRTIAQRKLIELLRVSISEPKTYGVEDVPSQISTP